jgi:hypothetical protein
VDTADVTVDLTPWEWALWSGNEGNFHFGDADQLTQPTDPLLAAETGYDMKYPGIAYVVFNRFALREWGHRIPQLTFEIVQKDPATVGDAVEKLMGNAGLVSSEWSSDNMTSELHGIGWKGGSNTVRTLEPLTKAYDLILMDVGNQLQFHDFQETEVQTVLQADLGCHEGTNRKEHLIEIIDVNDADLPDEVNLQYVDLDADHASGSQRERRNIDNADGHVMKLSVPIVLTAGEARHIAARFLYRAWKNRQEISIRLPLKYGNITAHDKLQIQHEGITYYMHVLQVDVGYNWLIKVRGYLEDSANDA